jgi:negative regulator of flagellin synthesis FlgM
MMISKSQIQSIIKAYSTQRIEEKTKKEKPRNIKTDKDRVELSTEARFYQLALSEIKRAPEIRKEKVEALKAQISKGTYSVSGEKVAEKLLERAIVDELI